METILVSHSCVLCKIVSLSYKWDEWVLFVPAYYYIQNIAPERNNINTIYERRLIAR